MREYPRRRSARRRRRLSIRPLSGCDGIGRGAVERGSADRRELEQAQVRAGSPDELQAFLTKEIARWAKVVKDNNIKAGD